MKTKIALIVVSIIAIINTTILVYVLNLKYYDNACNEDYSYCYNYEEKIIDLVNRIIVEQGGILK